MRTTLFLLFTGSLFSLSAMTQSLPRSLKTATRIADRVRQQSLMQDRSMARGQLHVVEENQDNVWDYWSMGMGCGLGMVYMGNADGDTKKFPWPDVRINIERSWYLTDKFTASVDVALLTQAVRLGYLLNERTRISCGLGLWLLGSYGINILQHSSINTDRLFGSNVAMKDTHALNTKNQLMLTPLVSLDHFLSQNCFVRITGSYDRIRLTIDNRQTYMLHWPQLTGSINFRF